MSEKVEKVVKGLQTAAKLAKPLATFDLQGDAVGQVVNSGYDAIANAGGNTSNGKEGSPKQEEPEIPEPNVEPASKSGGNPGGIIEGEFRELNKSSKKKGAISLGGKNNKRISEPKQGNVNNQVLPQSRMINPSLDNYKTYK